MVRGSLGGSQPAWTAVLLSTTQKTHLLQPKGRCSWSNGYPAAFKYRRLSKGPTWEMRLRILQVSSLSGIPSPPRHFLRALGLVHTGLARGAGARAAAKSLAEPGRKDSVVPFGHCWGPFLTTFGVEGPELFENKSLSSTRILILHDSANRHYRSIRITTMI